MPANKPTTPSQDGLAAVFEAIERLTYREMTQLGALLHMQVQDSGAFPGNQAEFAHLLSDTAESYFDAEGEDD